MAVIAIISFMVFALSATAIASTPGSVGTWNTTSALPQGLMEAASANYNGYVYVLGGNNISTGNQSTVYYAKTNSDGTVGTWNTTTSLPAPLFDSMAIAYNGYIYFIGGYHNGYFNTVDYAKLNSDGTVGTWNTTTALPQAVIRTKAVIDNGYLYIIGGNDGATLNTVYYAKINSDGTIGSWATSPNTLPQLVEGAGVVVYNNYVYVMGGVHGAYLNTIYYTNLNSDGTIGSWTTSPSTIPHVAADFGVVTYNGFIYVMGGYGNGFLNGVYYFEPNSDGSVGTWTTSTNSLPDTIETAVAEVYNGYVYFMTGYDNSNALNTVYYTHLTALPPALNNITSSVASNGSVVVDVLSGVSNADSSTLSIISGPAHGTAVDPPGTITYTPNKSYIGSDSLVFQVCSSLDNTICSQATLTFDVEAIAPNTGFNTPKDQKPLAAFILFVSVITIVSGAIQIRKKADSIAEKPQLT